MKVIKIILKKFFINLLVCASVFLVSCGYVDNSAVSHIPYDDIKSLLMFHHIVYEGTDYYIDLTYECVDGTSTCFKVLKEQTNQTNLKLYASLDKLNIVKEVSTFKTTGKKYNEIKEVYITKAKDYLISKEIYDEENVRYFNVELIKNLGRYRYKDLMYEDVYEIRLSYMCKDNGNTCITKIDDGNNTNLSFDVIMLLDGEDNIVLLESTKLFYK